METGNADQPLGNVMLTSLCSVAKISGSKFHFHPFIFVCTEIRVIWEAVQTGLLGTGCVQMTWFVISV